ncbi:hypothetical protein SCA6_007087, partial [Theobroma cacao]
MLSGALDHRCRGEKHIKKASMAGDFSGNGSGMLIVGFRLGDNQ